MLLNKVIKYYLLKFLNLKTKILLLILSANLFADNIYIKPDSYNSTKNCIVITKKQKYLGLLRFSSKEEFKKECNGKMFFIYEKDECRTFTMKNMKFNIYIQDKNKKSKFLINETKEVCGRIIIESLK